MHQKSHECRRLGLHCHGHRPARAGGPGYLSHHPALTRPLGAGHGSGPIRQYMHQHPFEAPGPTEQVFKRRPTLEAQRADRDVHHGVRLSRRRLPILVRLSRAYQPGEIGGYARGDHDVRPEHRTTVCMFYAFPVTSRASASAAKRAHLYRGLTVRSSRRPLGNVITFRLRVRDTRKPQRRRCRASTS